MKIEGKMSKKNFENKLIGLQNNMLNFAFTLTSNRNDAEDLLQETILRALNNQEKYYENANFKGWIFTIMHNIFINNYRRAVRSQTAVDQTDNLYYLNMPQDSGFDSPEASYTASEINKVIDSFPDEYKIPFRMHLSGFKYEEIAQNQSLPIGTVKSRIFFARRRLQEILKDYQYANEF